ncbi:MAG: hypothetical protein QOE67_714 [Solirubrobacteraceae bacterium]|nr:hypothetical protein [Solirubrobacteraceae bacterium]
MTSAKTDATARAPRPMRADARRNYDKLIAAARAAFTEEGTGASLEDIARRAEVGIGTLYRHFPSRQELLEAVYVGEVEAMCRSAEDLADLPPWDGLERWLQRFVGYVATKRALAEALFAYIDADAEVFSTCRTAFYEAAEPMLERAKQAGVVRPDADIVDVLQMVGGISKIQSTEPDQVQRILALALDGLRYRPPAA